MRAAACPPARRPEPVRGALVRHHPMWPLPLSHRASREHRAGPIIIHSPHRRFRHSLLYPLRGRPPTPPVLTPHPPPHASQTLHTLPPPAPH
eukprot:scaffold33443_cov90-Isochrysis_galbana.AAC.2